ncbi:MAG: hypothetical protein R8P61_18710 [Bacteroidia bacterium]|nr:hypothetical protein [Bacteroidia bacterium]
MKISDNILTKLDHPAKIVDLALDWELISSLQEKKWEEIPELSAFIHLKKLSLAGHEIQKLEGLIASLTQVDLSYNLLRETRGLAPMDNLKELDLSFNELENISEIAGCQQLTRLNLAHNFLKDLSPLSTLNKLQLLAISGNKRVKDLSFALNMEDLQTFYAKQLSLMDWGQLNNLSSLEALYISPISFESLNSLRSLPKLETLHLSANKVPEHGVLPYFPHLKHLSILKGKHLRKLDGIDKLTGLTHLNLAQNQLEQLPDLKGMQNLEEVILKQNPLLSIDALFELNNLKKLDIRDTGLKGSMVKKLIQHFAEAEVLF